MDFRPAPSRGGIIGLALVAGIVWLQGGLLTLAVRSGPGPSAAVLLVGTLLLLPIGLRLTLWLWGYLSLRYTVTRDGVLIRWGATRHAIPMEDISHVLNGRPYGAALQGLRWPGHEVGQTAVAVGEDETLQPALVLATQPPAGQILIVTPTLVYAISPSDRVAFVEEFRLRRRLGPVQRLSHSTTQVPWAQWTIWQDRLALRLAGLGLVLNLLAITWILWHYPTLPAMVPLHLTYDGAQRMAIPGSPRARSAVWLLPFIGLAGLMLNSGLAAAVHQRDRLAGLILLAGAVLVQVALGVALWRIL